MKRDQFSMALPFPNELVIDNFAGGGGTSTGLEAAFGRPVDIAINHFPEALAMHSPLAQPVLYVSPEQLAEHSDDGPEHGRYLPARKTPAGKFTQPLYAGAAPAAVAGPANDLEEVDLPDVEDMAHSAVQEALSCGVNHDVFHRWMRAVMDKTVEAMTAAPVAAPALEAPSHQCCNSWFLSLPEGRQAVLRENQWMLADAAYQAGRESSRALEAPAAPAEVEKLDAAAMPAQLSAIAAQAALDAKERHSYLPNTSAEAATWRPHFWVIQAMRAAIKFDRAINGAAAPQAPAAPVGVPAQGDPAALLQLAEVLESGRSLIHVERKEAAHALRLQAAAAPAEPAVDASDTALLDALAAESMDLRCFDMPTGQGDADVGWRVIQHHMGEPTERVVSEVYKDDPRSAIRAAIARLERDPYCTGALHEEDAGLAAQAKEGGEAA